MANANESDPAPPLPHLPDVAGLDGAGAAPAPSTGQESAKHLPEVHGLTPPGQQSSPASVSAEFAPVQPNSDLSAAVGLPGESPPPAPQPAPAVPGMAASDEMPPGTQRLAPGRMFGGYELVAKIGQGGMGEVYKARQVSLDRVVAIKILSKALYDNDEFIKRFEREAKAIARITHPNIVGVYDFGSIDGLRFMVNEFIDGSSLAKMIGDRLVLPPAEVLPLMVQCLAGLAHVGAQGIVHRDIKPDNILITKDGVAKIADFGLAKDVSNKSDHTDLTAAGLAMGTPAYMSPEQCMGQKLDARSDIYALGVTAYFALTGQKPFTGNSSFEIMTKQREHTPPAPHEVAPQIPRELSQVVMKMLAKRADERYGEPEQCRQAWIAVGVQHGIFGRSGEYDTTIPRSELPALVPLPPPPVPASAAPAAPPTAAPAPAAAPAPTSQTTAAPAPESGGPGARVSSPDLPAQSGNRPGGRTADPANRPTSERHPPNSERAVRKPSDTMTCPACGQLNRPDAPACTRCGNILKDNADPAALVAQEAEAQRLYDAKRFGDAAAIWARLADREPDKRARSVLRSKEREARKQEHDQRIADLRGRAQAAVTRGDLRGGLAMLEQGRELHKDASASTASSSVSDVQLERDIGLLRQRLAWRRRAWQIGVVLAVVLTAVLVLVLRLRAAAATPPPTAPPATPPAEPAEPPATTPAAPTGGQ